MKKLNKHEIGKNGNLFFCRFKFFTLKRKIFTFTLFGKKKKPILNTDRIEVFLVFQW